MSEEMGLYFSVMQWLVKWSSFFDFQNQIKNNSNYCISD